LTAALHDIVHDFSLRTQHCRHVHNHFWSGVFNLLKFDHTPKKKKKKKRRPVFVACDVLTHM